MNGRPTGDDREPRAVRLIFAYDGDEVRLESRQPAIMLAPAGDAVEVFDDHTGFWTEVREAQGTVLHRQILMTRCAAPPKCSRPTRTGRSGACRTSGRAECSGSLFPWCPAPTMCR